MSNSVSASEHEAVSQKADRSPVFSAIIGLAALAVLLQGLWAGIFLAHDGQRDDAAGWIDVHARGADVAILLTIAATIYAFVKLRSRRVNIHAL